MKYIYIYTTESFGDKDWYKIGESIDTPHERIEAPDTASSPELLLVLHSWIVDTTVSDRSRHAVLEDGGFDRLRWGRRWFELGSNPIEDINIAPRALGKIIIESTGEITYTEGTKESLVEYSIPYVNELGWALGISPEQSIPKQLELL
jgi:hypothetical protein